MNVCLFDIDGTLLSSGGAGKAALEAAFTEDFGVALRHQIPYSGRTDRAIMRDLFRMHGIDHSDANTARLMNAYLAKLPQSLTDHKGHILPGIEALLDWLHNSGTFSVGLLTGNVRAGAKVKLGHFGLYERFAFGGFGDRHFDRDDVAREAHQQVRELIGAHIVSDKIWVIGDTPLDVKCARAIGARVVAVATGHHSVEQLTASAPDLVLADLSDPRPLIDLWAIG